MLAEGEEQKVLFGANFEYDMPIRHAGKMLGRV